MTRESRGDDNPKHVPQAKNLYRLLGLNEGASIEDIDRAFRKKSIFYHPDINKSPEAIPKFQALVNARDELKEKLISARDELKAKLTRLSRDNITRALNQEAGLCTPGMTWEKLRDKPLSIFQGKSLGDVLLKEQERNIRRLFECRDFPGMTWSILLSVGREQFNGGWTLREDVLRRRPRRTTSKAAVQRQKSTKGANRLAELWNSIKKMVIAVMNTLWPKPDSSSKKDSPTTKPTPSGNKGPQPTGSYRPDQTPRRPKVLRIKDQ